jgi:hypothetical protein
MKKRTPSPQTASHTPCVSSHAWVHAWVRPRCFTSIHHRADKLSNRRVTPHLGLIRATLACMFLLATFAAVHAQSTLNLFNGLSLLGWTPHGSWTGNGGILSSSGAGNRGIVTVVPFEDFTLVFDYNESAPVGAKLRLWAPREGSGGAYIDLDLSGAQNKVGGVEGSRPSPIASMSEGWHHVQVEASHGHLDIHVDGQQAGTLTGNGPRAGYLGWDVTGSGNFQVRAVKLIPRGLTSAFNGSDLGGWKPVAHDPSSNGGIGHTVVKTFSFGLGGGSTKPHSAKWTVASGAMQGQDGPGGLEYSAPFDDGIVELNASVKGSIKSDHVTGVGLRDQPGKLGGGYLVGVGPYSGTIDGLAKHAISKSTNKVQETIAIAGRTTEIWESGNIVTVDTDPRAESDRTSAGAKTSAGALTLILPPDCTLDVQQIAVATLPAKGYGAAVAPPPPTVMAAASSPAATAPAATAAPSAAVTALLRNQTDAAAQAQQDRATKQRTASLMAQALTTNDPQQQMGLYNQVVQLDPSNSAAVQGFRDAQAKVQASQTAQAQQVQAQTTAEQTTQTQGQQVNGSIVKAQSALFAGHIGEASSALAVAERLAPDNPIARDLRQRINATSSLHTRLLYLGSGVGVLALVALLAVWFRRKRQQRYPMLEMTEGLDTGQQYPIEKDKLKIGAVAQDGGQKNDIVVRDVEHAISRFHCEITRQNGQLYLTDLASRNGTKLEGKQIPAGEPTLLRSGNRIRLADTAEFRLGYARGKPKA